MVIGVVAGNVHSLAPRKGTFSILLYLLHYNMKLILTLLQKENKEDHSQGWEEKNQKGTTTEEAPTLRIRAVVASEAAAKAKREALEVELKTAASREAAQAAARKEAEAAQAAAARDEFSATQAHEQVMEVMALEVQLPETAIQTTTARRYCSSSTDNMIMDYLCNKSIINQTLFSIGPYLLKMHWRLKCSQLGR